VEGGRLSRPTDGGRRGISMRRKRPLTHHFVVPPLPRRGGEGCPELESLHAGSDHATICVELDTQVRRIPQDVGPNLPVLHLLVRGSEDA